MELGARLLARHMHPVQNGKTAHEEPILERSQGFTPALPQRLRLTRKLFQSLPEGAYVQSNLGIYKDEVGPSSQRQRQWQSVPAKARYRLCDVYKTKAYHDALMRRLLAPLPSECLPKATKGLTRKLLLSLETGGFVVSKQMGIYVMAMAPPSEREQQWRSVPKALRHRPCSVYENEAAYQAAKQKLREFWDQPLSAIPETTEDDVPF